MFDYELTDGQEASRAPHACGERAFHALRYRDRDRSADDQRCRPPATLRLTIIGTATGARRKLIPAFRNPS